MRAGAHASRVASNRCHDLWQHAQHSINSIRTYIAQRSCKQKALQPLVFSCGRCTRHTSTIAMAFPAFTARCGTALLGMACSSSASSSVQFLAAGATSMVRHLGSGGRGMEGDHKSLANAVYRNLPARIFLVRHGESGTLEGDVQNHMVSAWGPVRHRARTGVCFRENRRSAESTWATPPRACSVASAASKP